MEVQGDGTLGDQQSQGSSKWCREDAHACVCLHLFLNRQNGAWWDCRGREYKRSGATTEKALHWVIISLASLGDGTTGTNIAFPAGHSARED